MPDLNPDVSTNGSKLAKIIRKKIPNNQYLTKERSQNKWKKNGDDILQVYRVFSLIVSRDFRMSGSDVILCFFNK